MLVRPELRFEEFSKMRKVEPRKKGLSTGFQDLDQHLLLAKRYLMGISGYPGCGKSEFLDAILINMSVMHGWRTLFFSPENHPIEEHMTKLSEKFIGKKFKSLTDDEYTKAFNHLNGFFSWIDLEEPRIDTILNLAKTEIKERGLDCLVIDPWNAVTHSRGSAMIHEYLSEALSTIIRFARINNILVAIVAHPKNPVKDKDGKFTAPTLYDISDGAMWRNKLDYGIICHRPNMLKNEIEIHIQKIKQKWMGRLGTLTMDYQWETGRFKSRLDKEFLLPTEVPMPF